MSEMTATAVETSAPMSSTEIAAGVVESAEQESASTSESSETTTSEPVAQTTEPEPVKTAQELSDEEALLREFGFTEMRYPDGKEYRIPRSKVLKMIASGLRRGTDKWDSERTTLSEKAKRADELHGFWEGFTRDFRGDPKAFLAGLAEHDPRYKSFLEPAAAPAPVGAEMPQPDLPLPDGSRTYSLEGIQKLLDWKAQDMLTRVEQKLKPWEERDQQARQQQERETAERARTDRIRTTLETAKSWDHWTEWEGEILKALQEDSAKATAEKRAPSLSLREAYLEVKATKTRETVLKELNGAPKAPAIARQGAETTRPAGPRTTQDVVRETIAKLEASNP